MRTLPRGLRRTLSLSAVVGMIIGGTAAPSTAAVVFTVDRCGETVTGDVRLQEDLDCRDIEAWWDEDEGVYDLKPFAISIQGPGTLDLNGYTVRVAPIEVDDLDDLEHIEYDEFDDPASPDAALERVPTNIEFSGEVGSFEDYDDLQQEYSLEFFPSVAVLVQQATGVTVRNGVVRGARGEYSLDDVGFEGRVGNQILVFDSLDVTLEDLVVSQNANISGTGPGVLDVDNAFDGAGIAIVRSDRVSLDGIDAFQNDGNGLTVYASASVSVADASFNDNEEDGIWVAGGFGDPGGVEDGFDWPGSDAFRGSSDLDLTDVTVNGNGSDGIDTEWNYGWHCFGMGRDDELCDDPYENAPEAERNAGGTWTRVTANHNENDGLHVSGQDGLTIVDARALRNGDDGLDLWISDGVTVRDSTFESNEDDGIFEDDSPFLVEVWLDEFLGPFGLGAAVEGGYEADGDPAGEDYRGAELEGSGDAAEASSAADGPIAPKWHEDEPDADDRVPNRFHGNLLLDSATGDGIDAHRVVGSEYLDNHLEGNDERGLELERVLGVLVSRNTFVDNDSDGLGAFGIVLATISRNTATGNGDDGFFLDSYDNDEYVESGAVRFERNRAERNEEDGIDVHDVDESHFLRNVAVDNDQNGFEVDGSDDSLYERNVAEHNGSDGFKIDTDTDNSEFRQNRSSWNFYDGFNFVDPDFLVVRNNRADRNGDDGFEIENHYPEVRGFARYQGNRAQRNGYEHGGWGHISNGDVVDDRPGRVVRGNSGKRNAAGQCLNVRCGKRLIVAP